MTTWNDTFSGRSQYQLRLVATEGTVDTDNNRSQVNWTLSIVETTEWGSWSNNELTWSLNIGGQTASGSTTYNFNNYDSLTLRSGSYWIAHNADGTKSISVSASAGGGTTIGSASLSGTLGLTTIARASQPTVSGATDAGSSMTISTNRASSSFTHTLTYLFGTASGTIATGVGASYAWTIPLTLLSQIPNATSGIGTITCKTYNGSTLIGTKSVGFTVKAGSAIVPTFTSVTCTEFVTSVSTNVGAFVQGVSKFTCAITGAAGVYGSTIQSYKIEVLSGSTVLQTINSASGTTPNPISASGTITIKGTITDSRGRTATSSGTVTVMPYAPPVLVSTSAQRALNTGVVDTNNGTYIRANINATVSSLINGTQKNKIQYKVSVRPNGTSTWTVVSPLQSPTGITFNSYYLASQSGGFALTDSFDVLIAVNDLFSTSQVMYTVPTASIFMHWGNPKAGEGVGIGKYWESGGLDVATSLRLGSITDASLTSTDHALQIGPTSGANLIADNNELMARNNGAYTGIMLNRDGGDVLLGASSSNVQIDGSLVLAKSNAALWTGVYYMSDTQSITLSAAISAQTNGILLVWSGYASGAAQNYNWHYTFVPKWHVANASGAGMIDTWSNGAGAGAALMNKYVYISDTTITGYAGNDDSPNNASVLRAVLGV